jgi:hypothetical protein
VTADGRIYGWGDNEFYQLGLPNRVQTSVPAELPLNGALTNKLVKLIDGGDGHTLVVTRIYVQELAHYIGHTAELLVIQGSEFGTTRADVRVELSGGTCNIRSVNETMITCVLPDRLALGPLFARVFVLDEDSGDPVQVRTVVPGMCPEYRLNFACANVNSAVHCAVHEPDHARYARVNHSRHRLRYERHGQYCDTAPASPNNGLPCYQRHGH